MPEQFELIDFNVDKVKHLDERCELTKAGEVKAISAVGLPLAADEAGCTGQNYNLASKDSNSYKRQRRTEKGSSTTQNGTLPVNGLLRWAPARKDRIWRWGAAPLTFPKRARWCPSR